jgi:5,10-methenyltetrahydrofolate synthetase
MVTTVAESPSRRALRERLAGERAAWLGAHPEAPAALAAALAPVLRQLEPGVLGLYWAIRAEFNAAAFILGDKGFAALPLALPYCTRTPPAMAYRRWDRRPPPVQDECGIPTATGAAVDPDIVLVPCVGFTADGWRLGYGGGFFDRWLAGHSGVTTIGLAWSCGELPPGSFAPQPHDRALDLVVTERGVVG